MEEYQIQYEGKLYSGLSMQGPTSYDFTLAIEIRNSFNILLVCQLIDWMLAAEHPAQDILWIFKKRTN